MIVDIAGTQIDWASIGEWCARVMEEGGKLRPSSEHYGRLSDLYRSLTVERVRRSTDRPGIERAARMSDLGRRNPVPAYHGLASVLSRSEMGTMLVELRNRGLSSSGAENLHKACHATGFTGYSFLDELMGKHSASSRAFVDARLHYNKRRFVGETFRRTSPNDCRCATRHPTPLGDVNGAGG